MENDGLFEGFVKKFAERHGLDHLKAWRRLCSCADAYAGRQLMFAINPSCHFDELTNRGWKWERRKIVEGEGDIDTVLEKVFVHGYDCVVRAMCATRDFSLSGEGGVLWLELDLTDARSEFPPDNLTYSDMEDLKQILKYAEMDLAQAGMAFGRKYKFLDYRAKRLNKKYENLPKIEDLRAHWREEEMNKTDLEVLRDYDYKMYEEAVK